MSLWVFSNTKSLYCLPIRTPLKMTGEAVPASLGRSCFANVHALVSLASGDDMIPIVFPGSGQQSVTGVTTVEDSNSYWSVRGVRGAACLRGIPVRCGQTIRLTHLNTGRNLHSHYFASPLSSNQASDFFLCFYVCVCAWEVLSDLFKVFLCCFPTGGECFWGERRGRLPGWVDGAVRWLIVAERRVSALQAHCHRGSAVYHRRAVRATHPRATGGSRHVCCQPAQLLEGHGGHFHEAQWYART